MTTREQTSESLSDKHWTEGGTAITNFGEECFPLYIEAIERFGDKNLVVSDERYGSSRGKQPGGSLHDLRGAAGLDDFSAFGRILEQVVREFARGEFP
jgi:hypothetical protein